MKTFIKKHRSTILLIAGLLLLIYFIYAPYIKTPTIFKDYFTQSDANNFIGVNQMLAKESLKAGEFPLLHRYILSGSALFAGPTVDVLSLNGLTSFFSSSPMIGFKIAQIIHYLLGIFGIYYLARLLKLERKYAVIAALVYLMNGTAALFLFSYSWMMAAYAYLPWIIILAIKSFTSKYWLLCSIGIGFLFALDVLGGAVEWFLLSYMFFLMFLLYKLIEKRSKERVKRVISIGIIATLFFAGFAAIKLLPAKEFVAVSNREEKFPYEYFLGQGHHIETNNIMRYLVRYPDNPFPQNLDGSAQIGYVAAFLVLVSFARWKEKRILFLQLSMIFFILYAMRSPISYLIWKFVPIIGQQRNTDKMLFIFILLASLLAAFGFEWLMKKAAKYNMKEKWKKVLPYAIVILILIDMNILGITTTFIKIKPDQSIYQLPIVQTKDITNIKEARDASDIFKYIAAQKTHDGEFRVKYFDIHTPHGAAVNHFNVPYGIEPVFGGAVNILTNDFFFYGSLTENNPNNNAKLYGILNAKYIIAQNEIVVPGYTLVKKFDTVINPEWRQYTHGPYLYENELFLPRAYTTENAILVTGEENQVTRLVYALLLHPSFDPKKAAIVQSEKPLGSYTLSELNRFKAIILTNAIDQNTATMLQDYIQEGGILLPNIFAGEQSIGNEELESLFAGLEGEAKTATITKYTPNTMTIEAEEKGKFLVVSEKLSIVPGWNIVNNDKKAEVYRANGVVSAVYLENENNTVNLFYKPKSFVVGKNITLLTIAVALVILSYFWYRKRKKFKG